MVGSESDMSKDDGPDTEKSAGQKAGVPSKGQNWENKDLAPG